METSIIGLGSASSAGWRWPSPVLGSWLPSVARMSTMGFPVHIAPGTHQPEGVRPYRRGPPASCGAACCGQPPHRPSDPPHRQLQIATRSAVARIPPRWAPIYPSLHVSAGRRRSGATESGPSATAEGGHWSHRQALASLGPTRPNHCSAGLCRHSLAEPVGLRPLANVGLIGALHTSTSFSTSPAQPWTTNAGSPARQGFGHQGPGSRHHARRERALRSTRIS